MKNKEVELNLNKYLWRTYATMAARKRISAEEYIQRVVTEHVAATNTLLVDVLADLKKAIAEAEPYTSGTAKEWLTKCGAWQIMNKSDREIFRVWLFYLVQDEQIPSFRHYCMNSKGRAVYQRLPAKEKADQNKAKSKGQK